MIRGNQSISYYSTGNVVVWMLMAFQAGVLNVGGLLACHRFVSHVTGVWTLLGVAARDQQPREFAALLLVPFAFLVGSMVSGWLVDIRLRMDRQPKYYVVFGILFFCILAVALAGMGGFFGAFGANVYHARTYLLTAALCAICGLQNGTITTVSKAVVRTSHLTGITTDLGLGIVRHWNRHRLTDPLPHEGRANLMRAGIIVYFVFGAFAGAYSFPRFGFGGFLLPTVTAGGLFGAMLWYQVRKVGG